ncbi:RluA family pseudouridine synthase [Patescibacteria group bacterium]|nr:RluA family pseudouridine synthase [Patescibacteria group bacterium]
MKDIEIIYEDKNLLLLNKPAGVVSTRERRNEKNQTVSMWLERSFGWSKKLERGGLVHRLDKGTSGILLVAKSEGVLAKLKEQFKKREVKKRYVALIEGDVSFEGEVLAPIKRNVYVFGKWGVDIDGKEAWTKFRLLEKYEKDGKKYNLVEIDLKTGRTHQIRVHFSYLGWPLVGDRVYGGNLDLFNKPFLHAKYIGFKHPVSNKFVEFEIEMAEELKNILNKLKVKS